MAQSFLLGNDEQKIKDFMRDISIRKLPGIGPMTELILNNLGVYRCCDVLARSSELTIAMSKGLVEGLITNSLGIGRYEHDGTDNPEDGPKSISTSDTFQNPIVEYDEFKFRLVALCEELAEKMRQSNLCGMNLSLVFMECAFNQKTSKQ